MKNFIFSNPTEVYFDKDCFLAAAGRTNITAECCKKLTHEETYQILMEAF